MERFLENAMYASRWLLAPVYFGLSLGLIALSIKFFQEIFHVLPHIFSVGESELILTLLSLVDMTLDAPAHVEEGGGGGSHLARAMRLEAGHALASTEGLGATPGDTPYVAAKTGVTGLTRGLAVDLGRDGITVNCICPGPIRTGMTDRVPEEDKAVFAKRRTALRRYGEPEEVAHVTLGLVLPAASYITGAVIPVDGGLMARNA